MRPRRTFKEWIAAFIENDEEEEANYRAQLYKQRAEDGHDDMLGTNTDPRDDGHEDGYYDDLDLDIDESFLEGLIIFTLAATLLVLVYIRQQRNRQRPNENGANQGAAAGAGDGNDRGFFPQPGEPEFGQWAAGGIGH